MTQVQKILRDQALTLEASVARLRAMAEAATDRGDREALMQGASAAKTAADDIRANHPEAFEEPKPEMIDDERCALIDLARGLDIEDLVAHAVGARAAIAAATPHDLNFLEDRLSVFEGEMERRISEMEVA